MLLAGCGDSDTPISGTTVITYRLAPAQGPSDMNGSLIEFARPGVGAPPLPPEPLSGTFEVVRLQPPPSNTRFAFSIVRLQFTSDSYVVNGNSGSITATFDPESPLSVDMPVSINGGPVELTGKGSPDTFTAAAPPAFRAVVVASDSGYAMILFAAPVSSP